MRFPWCLVTNYRVFYYIWYVIGWVNFLFLCAPRASLLQYSPHCGLIICLVVHLSQNVYATVAQILSTYPIFQSPIYYFLFFLRSSKSTLSTLCLMTQNYWWILSFPRGFFAWGRKLTICCLVTIYQSHISNERLDHFFLSIKHGLHIWLIPLNNLNCNFKFNMVDFFEYLIYHKHQQSMHKYTDYKVDYTYS